MTELEGTCHCGAVQIVLPSAPTELLQCNCSLCRKTGWIGAYYHPDSVAVSARDGVLRRYEQGDRTITAWHCAKCGPMTHWTPLAAPPDRMGVNMRMFEPGDWQHLPIRKVDGASF